MVFGEKSRGLLRKKNIFLLFCWQFAVDFSNAAKERTGAKALMYGDELDDGEPWCVGISYADDL